jgi:hypothetical protein
MSTDANSHDDRVLDLCRWTTYLVIPVLLLGFGILYLLPGETERLFAWPIASRMSAMLMGAGYGAGAIFFILSTRERRWHRFGHAMLGISAFVWPLILATFLHWDKFSHGSPAFWLWFVVYLITPLLLPWLWWRNRGQDSGGPEPGEPAMPPVLIQLFQLAILPTAAIALWLFLAPASAAAWWPWPLTPLTARVVAAWFFLPAAILWILARDGRWSSARLTFIGGLVWNLLLLVAVARAWNEFDPTRAGRWLYPLSLIAAALAQAGMLWFMRGSGRARS